MNQNRNEAEDSELFDDDSIKKLPKYEDISNPRIVSLIRNSTPPVIKHRKQIESWYKNIPEVGRADIKSRLLSTDDRQHMPAFYELMLHQFLLEERCVIEKHPKLGNKRPDYLVKDIDNKPLFYFEVATVFQDKGRERQEKNFDKLLKKLNKIHHYFLILVNTNEYLPEQVNYQEIVKDVTSWLDSFDPKSILKVGKHKLDYKKNGLNIEFVLCPRRNLKKGPIVGSWMGPGQWGPVAAKQIRRTIQNKIKKYKDVKKINFPMIIAICNGSEFGTDEFELECEIFGKAQIIFTIGKPNSDSKWTRDLSGLLIPTPAFPDARNKRLSAILYCDRLWDDKEGRMLYKMKLYHNPWANIKLGTKVFDKIPQFCIAHQDSKGTTCQWVNDSKQYIVFSN